MTDSIFSSTSTSTLAALAQLQSQGPARSAEERRSFDVVLASLLAEMLPAGSGIAQDEDVAPSSQAVPSSNLLPLDLALSLGKLGGQR